MSQHQATALLDALKAHLKSQGLTYKALAERCDLTETTIKRLLNRPHIPLDQLLQLCSAAKTDITSLIMLAEQANNTDILEMTIDQADAIFEQPALLAVLSEVHLGVRSVQSISESFGINKPSAYLYARKLEQLGCFSLDGDEIKLKFPLQSALVPDKHRETTELVLDNMLAAIKEFSLGPKEGLSPKDATVHCGFTLLSDEDYSEMNRELGELTEKYGAISLNNIKHPNPKSKPREHCFYLVPKKFSLRFNVPNLVDDVAGN